MTTIKLLQEDASTLVGILPDVIQCMVTEERNGNFELTMQYPNQKQYSDQLLKGKVIQCNAADELLNQKFRIYNIRKTMRNILEVKARHISFDLVYDFIKSISIVNQPCSYALNEIFRNSNFSQHYQGFSDIVNAQDFNVEKVNCLEAIGGTRGSIIDTFGTGAEILRDNTNIHVLNKRGHDNGVHITYAKNMTDINVEEDTTDLVTRIYAYAIYRDDQTSTEIVVEAPNGGFVDSPRIGNYEHPFIKPMNFSDKFEENVIPTPDQVQQQAERYFRDNSVDIPKINYKLGFVPLSKTTEGGPTDDIKLCDIVYVDDTRYNIQTQAKAIKTTFNVLKNRYESIELGQPKSTLGDLIGEGGGEVGPPGPPGPQGPAGADGNIGDFPESLPVVPQLTLTQLGMSSIQCDWTFENKVYYTYQLYASKVKDFTPTAFDLIHEGQASSFLFAAKPGETWYFRVRAGNTHNKWTNFSSQMSITLDKASQMDQYFTSVAIGEAVARSITADYMYAGIFKGQWIDAKNLSVTDGNGKRTLDIDSFGNVNLDVTTLKIRSEDAATTNQLTTVEQTLSGQIGGISNKVTSIENWEQSDTNRVLNSKVYQSSSDYGFGYKQVILEKGKEYSLTANGRVNQQALNDGKSLAVIIYNDDWTWSRAIYINSLSNANGDVVFTSPDAGVYNIQSYMYPDGGNRSGEVTSNWYKCVEGNRPAIAWSPAPEDINGRVDVQQSEIVQLSNEIKTKVDVNGVKSTITQSALEVQVAFNNANPNVQNNQKFTVYNGMFEMYDTNRNKIMYVDTDGLISSVKGYATYLPDQSGMHFLGNIIYHVPNKSGQYDNMYIESNKPIKIKTALSADGTQGRDYQQIISSGIQLDGKAWDSSGIQGYILAADAELDTVVLYNQYKGIKTNIIARNAEFAQLTVSGAKNRIVNTENYGTVKLNAVESAECYFEDRGRGKITNGKCVIEIDPIFAETVNLLDYDVNISKYGRGDIWVSERKSNNFTVEADNDIEFSYILYAKQKDYENTRLEQHIKTDIANDVDFRLKHDIKTSDIDKNNMWNIYKK